MATLDPNQIAQIAEVVDNRVLQHMETIREEFYTQIQALGGNHQALSEMLATHNNPDMMAAIAHDMWRRMILMEADHIMANMDAAGQAAAEMAQAGVAGEQPQYVAKAMPEPEPEPDPFVLEQDAQAPPPNPGAGILRETLPATPAMPSIPQTQMQLCPNRVELEGQIVHPPMCQMCEGTGKVPVQ